MESWNLRGSPRRLPISVLTGFLGSDKTTVLNYLIQQLTLRDAMVRIETEALRSTCSPVSLPPIEGRSEDKGQLAEAAAG